MKPSIKRVLIAAATLLVLGGVNWSILAKERIKDNGESILLALAPVDPRSLMQGDYMALRFEIESHIPTDTSGSIGLLVAPNRVATVNPDQNAAGLRIKLPHSQWPRLGRHQRVLLRRRHRRALRGREIRRVPRGSGFGRGGAGRTADQYQLTLGSAANNQRQRGRIRPPAEPTRPTTPRREKPPHARFGRGKECPPRPLYI